MSTRDTITETVRVLLDIHDMSKAELAEHMGLNKNYMPRKMNEGRWTVDELDTLADVFELKPADFVRGLIVTREIKWKSPATPDEMIPVEDSREEEDNDEVH